jgi:hypothetical protein
MNVKEALADARVLLRRGHKARAQALLERVVSVHPDNEPALAMLSKLRPSPRSAPRPSSDKSPAVAAKPAQVAPRVITRKVPFEDSVRPSKGRTAKHKTSVGSTLCPRCKASVRSGKMKAHFKAYHRRRGKSTSVYTVSY